ncbi:MAG TPA: hypothetical protein VMT08_04830 [Bradyrhizobium sp.]|nr:hypothetical protein [Bradyrhizobium sp.]
MAGLYVDAERNIEFLPFELALLSNLADALRTLDGRFRAEEAQLNKAHKTPLPRLWPGDARRLTCAS